MYVSVIIPIYNAEKYLNQAIDSALSQEETNEVILINDNSTDESEQICLNWQQTSKRVKYFKHLKNGSTSIATNIGISNAKSKYTAILASDDYYLSNRFSDDIKILESDNSLDGVANWLLVDKENTYKNELMSLFNGQIIGPRTTNKIIKFNDFCLDENFSITSLTLRSEIYKELLFNEALVHSEDFEFIGRLLSQYNIISGNHKTPKTAYRIHNSNKTSSLKNVYKHRKTTYELVLKKIVFDPTILLKVKYKIFKTYLDLYTNYLFPIRSKLRYIIKCFLLPCLIIKILLKIN